MHRSEFHPAGALAAGTKSFFPAERRMMESSTSITTKVKGAAQATVETQTSLSRASRPQGSESAMEEHDRRNVELAVLSAASAKAVRPSGRHGESIARLE